MLKVECFSYTVPKKETRDFHREEEIKSDSSQILTEAVHKALRYLDHNELPVHWERSSLFNTQTMDSDSEDILSDVSLKLMKIWTIYCLFSLIELR